MCLTSATSSHYWDSYRVLVRSLFGRRPRLSPDSSTLVSLFLGPIQSHVPCDFQDTLETLFESPLVSCFYVSLVLDVVYCTTKILTLSHWVPQVMYTSRSSRASVVMILHFMRVSLFLCISSLDHYLYSASHWGHHYVSSIVYILISSHYLSLDPHFYFETLLRAWVCPPRPYTCLRLYVPHPFFRRNTNQKPL